MRASSGWISLGSSHRGATAGSYSQESRLIWGLPAMKTDYIAEPDDLPFSTPIVRLMAFTTAEVEQLRSAVLRLANGDANAFTLHEQPWVTTGGLQFIWRHSNAGQRSDRISHDGPFIFENDAHGWREVQSCWHPSRIRLPVRTSG